MATEYTTPAAPDVAPGFYWVKLPNDRVAILVNAYEACGGAIEVNALTDDAPRGALLSDWMAENPDALFAPAVAPPLPGEVLPIVGKGRALNVAQSNVSGSMVAGSQAGGLTVFDCDAQNASVDKVDLTGLHLTRCNLTGARFDKCDLSDVTVNGSPIHRVPPLVTVSSDGEYLTVHGAVPSADVDLVPRSMSGVSLTADEAAGMLREILK